MNEAEYQRKLIKKLKKAYPGCIILKNDSSYLQGVPDLIILFTDRWAMLEVKMDALAKEQPNQEFYIEELGEMSYASFINPSNEDRVLDELQRTLRPYR